MEQLTLLSEEHHANPSQLQASEKDLKILEEISHLPFVHYLISLDPSGSFGKTCQVSSVPIKDETFLPSSQRWLNSGMGSATGCLTLKTSESHSEEEECLLSDILETGNLLPRYYLSPVACNGILRRAKKRGKKLPPTLYQALLTVSKQLATTSQDQTDST